MRQSGCPTPLRVLCSNPHRKPTTLLAWLAVAAFLLGCTPAEEPISSYTVKKHELIQVSLQPSDEPAADLPLSFENPTDRILGAVILFEDVAWYIKGAAPVGDWPENAADEFGKLVSSLKFDDPAKPSWDLSDEWTEKPGSSSMRAADLVFGEVTFSVIKLPNTGPTDRKYLLSNMNRWRRQVSLGAIDSAELANTSQKISTADGESATVVDYLGKKDNASMPPMMQNGGMARGPFQSSPQAPQKSGGAPTAKPAPGFTSTPPDAWELTESRMFQRARYVVKSGDDSGFASVSQAGGDVMMNVNRWRGQVGLPPISSKDDVNADPVKVGGVSGILVRLIGEKNGIIVAMVPDAKSNWFFKLEGPSTLVESEAEAFASYLDTVKFE